VAEIVYWPLNSSLVISFPNILEYALYRYFSNVFRLAWVAGRSCAEFRIAKAPALPGLAEGFLRISLMFPYIGEQYFDLIKEFQ
jgi:hypothetical protein